MYRWVNESVPFAGAAFRQWIVEFYQENRLARDILEMDGRPVRLADIRCPVLNIAASRDQIAPRPTTSVVTERVGSGDASEIGSRAATSGSSSAARPARTCGQGSAPGSAPTTDREGRSGRVGHPPGSPRGRPVERDVRP